MANETKINIQERQQIHACLSDEYQNDEIVSMLDAATFEKDENGVMVTYDNGVQDYFKFQKTLVHSHNVKP